MLRKIIEINENRCNGCGLCAQACHEGAIGMVDGKARLLREDYCDGLGDCLPVCPVDAISFVERQAPAYDQQAVMAAQAAKAATLPCGCPGSQSRRIERPTPQVDQGQVELCSELTQWPVQLKLVPVRAPYLDGADLLIAADCTAFAYGDFHRHFMKGRTVLVGCPKLDEGDYTEKLTDLLRLNDVKHVTVVRMEVPCCGGLEQAVKRARQNCGKNVPLRVAVLSTDGRIVSDNS